MSTIQPLFDEIKKQSAPRIVITTHHKPDADALGSCLGLYNFFKNAGLQSTVLSPTDYGDFLDWMSGEKQVVNFEENKEKGQALVAEADYIFCLDFNALSRINEMGPMVKASKAKKILIDHHLNPEHFYDYEHWNSDSSSTCELMFEVLRLWDYSLMGKEIAQCLYAGIMTDTGSFRFPSTHSHTHEVVAELLKFGIEHHFIHEAIFDAFAENRIRFVGYVLAKKLVVLNDYHVAYMSVTHEELKEYNISTGDTEGLVNFGLSIRGIKLAALFIDRKQLVKMSFRSKGNFPANEFASKYFNGGGHFNAAGGQSELPLEDTVEKFINVLPEWAHLLK
jgi:phosphoesterase RecJ-like protein